MKTQHITLLVAALLAVATAARPEESDGPAAQATVTHWHLYLRTDGVLVFSDGSATTVYVFSSTDEPKRRAATVALLERIEKGPPRTSIAVIHASHGNIKVRDFDHYQDLLLALASFEIRHRPPEAWKSKCLAVRLVSIVATQESLPQHMSSKGIRVPEAFLNHVSR